MSDTNQQSATFVYKPDDPAFSMITNPIYNNLFKSSQDTYCGRALPKGSDEANEINCTSRSNLYTTCEWKNPNCMTAANNGLTGNAFNTVADSLLGRSIYLPGVDISNMSNIRAKTTDLLEKASVSIPCANKIDSNCIEDPTCQLLTGKKSSTDAQSESACIPIEYARYPMPSDGTKKPMLNKLLTSEEMEKMYEDNYGPGATPANWIRNFTLGAGDPGRNNMFLPTTPISGPESDRSYRGTNGLPGIKIEQNSTEDLVVRSIQFNSTEDLVKHLEASVSVTASGSPTLFDRMFNMKGTLEATYDTDETTTSKIDIVNNIAVFNPTTVGYDNSKPAIRATELGYIFELALLETKDKRFGEYLVTKGSHVITSVRYGTSVVTTYNRTGISKEDRSAQKAMACLGAIEDKEAKEKLEEAKKEQAEVQGVADGKTADQNAAADKKAKELRDKCDKIYKNCYDPSQQSACVRNPLLWNIDYKTWYDEPNKGGVECSTNPADVTDECSGIVGKTFECTNLDGGSCIIPQGRGSDLNDIGNTEGVYGCDPRLWEKCGSIDAAVYYNGTADGKEAYSWGEDRKYCNEWPTINQTRDCLKNCQDDKQAFTPAGAMNGIRWSQYKDDIKDLIDAHPGDNSWAGHDLAPPQRAGVEGCPDGKCKKYTTACHSDDLSSDNVTDCAPPSCMADIMFSTRNMEDLTNDYGQFIQSAYNTFNSSPGKALDDTAWGKIQNNPGYYSVDNWFATSSTDTLSTASKRLKHLLTDEIRSEKEAIAQECAREIAGVLQVNNCAQILGTKTTFGYGKWGSGNQCNDLLLDDNLDCLGNCADLKSLDLNDSLKLMRINKDTNESFTTPDCTRDSECKNEGRCVSGTCVECSRDAMRSADTYECSNDSKIVACNTNINAVGGGKVSCKTINGRPRKCVKPYVPNPPGSATQPAITVEDVVDGTDGVCVPNPFPTGLTGGGAANFLAGLANGVPGVEVAACVGVAATDFMSVSKVSTKFTLHESGVVSNHLSDRVSKMVAAANGVAELPLIRRLLLASGQSSKAATSIAKLEPIWSTINDMLLNTVSPIALTDRFKNVNGDMLKSGDIDPYWDYSWWKVDNELPYYFRMWLNLYTNREPESDHTINRDNFKAVVLTFQKEILHVAVELEDAYGQDSMKNCPFQTHYRATTQLDGGMYETKCMARPVGCQSDDDCVYYENGKDYSCHMKSGIRNDPSTNLGRNINTIALDKSTKFDTNFAGEQNSTNVGTWFLGQYDGRQNQYFEDLTCALRHNKMPNNCSCVKDAVQNAFASSDKTDPKNMVPSANLVANWTAAKLHDNNYSAYSVFSTKNHRKNAVMNADKYVTIIDPKHHTAGTTVLHIHNNAEPLLVQDHHFGLRVIERKNSKAYMQDKLGITIDEFVDPDMKYSGLYNRVETGTARADPICKAMTNNAWVFPDVAAQLGFGTRDIYANLDILGNFTRKNSLRCLRGKDSHHNFNNPSCLTADTHPYVPSSGGSAQIPGTEASLKAIRQAYAQSTNLIQNMDDVIDQRVHANPYIQQMAPSVNKCLDYAIINDLSTAYYKCNAKSKPSTVTLKHHIYSDSCGDAKDKTGCKSDSCGWDDTQSRCMAKKSTFDWTCTDVNAAMDLIGNEQKGSSSSGGSETYKRW